MTADKLLKTARKYIRVTEYNELAAMLAANETEE